MLDTVTILRSLIVLAFMYLVNLLLKAHYRRRGVELLPKAFAVSEKKVFVDILPIKYEFTTQVQEILKAFIKSNEKEVQSLSQDKLKKLLEFETKFLQELFGYSDIDYMNNSSFTSYYQKLKVLLEQIVDIVQSQ